MISIYSLSALILAYLFGSIPTAVWIGQAFYGIDVREYGSGNAGATNTFRVLGKKAGIAVMFLDIFKGYTATNLAYLIGLSVTGPQNSVQFVNYQLALGVTAVLGHLFPVFAGFRGGKGSCHIIWYDIGSTLGGSDALRSYLCCIFAHFQICITEFHNGRVFISPQYNFHISISNTFCPALWNVYLCTDFSYTSKEYRATSKRKRVQSRSV
jgi:acyl-phosphate glycerol 3-phosphate acyltransferase